MSTEPHRSLTFPRKRNGAASVRVARAAATCAVASRLRSSSSARLSYIALSGAVGVASFGAGLRSSSRRRVRVASRFAVQRHVAVRSVSSGPHPARLLRPASLPNNSLEPTLKRLRLHFASALARLNSSVGLYRSRMNNEHESHRSRTFPRKRHGAAVGACCTRRSYLCRRIAASFQLICTTELHRTVRGSRGGFVRRGASFIVAPEGSGRIALLQFNASVAVRSVSSGLHRNSLASPSVAAQQFVGADAYNNCGFTSRQCWRGSTQRWAV